MTHGLRKQFVPETLDLKGAGSCPGCGAPVEPEHTACPSCGETLSPQAPPMMKRLVLRLHKAHDVARERRVPKGQKGAGEWTAGAAGSLFSEEAAPAPPGPNDKPSAPLRPQALATVRSVPALSLSDSKKVELALSTGQAEINRDGTTYTLHVRPAGSKRKRKVGEFTSLNAARAQVLPALGDTEIGYADVGAKIGGARKDIAAVRSQFEVKPTEDALKRLEKEDPAAAARSVVKGTLWKMPTVEEMKAGGAEPHAVFLAQAIHSVISAKPEIVSPEGRAHYFAGVTTVRKAIDGSVSFEKMAERLKDLQSSAKALLVRQKYEETLERTQGSISMLQQRIKEGKVSYLVEYDQKNLDRAKVRLAELKAQGKPKVTSYQAEISLQMMSLGDRFRALIGLPSTSKTRGEMTIGGRKCTFAMLTQPWMNTKSNITGRRSDMAKTTTPEEQWQEVRTSFGKSDTLNAPVATATPERIAEEQAILEERERLRAWEKSAPTDYERRGGKAVPIRRPEDYLRTFGLRGVEFGNWMDNAASKQHVERCAEAFSDLADSLGIPAKDLAMKGRLALAFGARGHTAASAHYEPHKVVINLTKLGGAGSLAHEWGHFMDHILYRQEADNPTAQTLLSDVVRTTRKEDFAGRYGEPIPSHTSPIGRAMAGVMDAIMHGNGWASTSYRPQPDKSRYSSWSGVDTAFQHNAQDASKALLSLAENNPTYFTDKKLIEAANYLGRRYGITTVKIPVKGASQFLLNMRLLDGSQKGSYFATRVELFARCFESYVHDKLGEKRRANNYLVRNTKGAGDGGMFDIYPRAEHRTQINAAFDKLMEQIRETGALQKAYGMLYGPRLRFVLAKAHGGFSYSSTHFLLPKEVSKAIRDFSARIPADQLGEDGREDNPHITLKYGLHTQDGRKVAAVLKEQRPVHVTFGPVSIFRGADNGKDYDVVKVAVYSPDLQQLNQYLCSKLPHTDTFAAYHPHATIAYVKAGKGALYEGAKILDGKIYVLDHLVFSNRDKEETHITLSGSRMAAMGKGLRLRLHKARDTSGESRVPKGGKGAGEWTKTPGVKASDEEDAPLPKADAKAVQARGVYDLLVSRIHADPKRFQFKSNVSLMTGAGDELKGVQKFDPELSGIISVWLDPANGKTYVVNGHHRLDLAKRLRRRSVTVRYLDAPTAEKAMIKGTLINIAEGRGTPVDAAKLFRQTKIGKAQLEAAGLSLRGSLAESASNLASLCPTLWNKVVSGAMTAARGAVIGKAFAREPEQLALNNMLERPEIKRKRLSDDAIGELAKFVDTAGRRTKTIDTLFGEESLIQNLAVEKAQVSAVLKARLSADRRLFGYVSNSGRAKRLANEGNVLETSRNAQISHEAAQTEAVYDKLSRFSGPISDALNQAAKEVANGTSVKDAADHAFPKIRAVVAGIASGRGEGHAGVAGGGDSGGTHESEPPSDGGLFTD